MTDMALGPKQNANKRTSEPPGQESEEVDLSVFDSLYGHSAERMSSWRIVARDKRDI